MALSSLMTVVEGRNCTSNLGCQACRDAGGIFCEADDTFFGAFPSVCVCSGFGTGFFGDCNDFSFGSSEPPYCDFFLEVGVYLIPGLGIPLLILACWAGYTFMYRMNNGLVTQGNSGGPQAVPVQAWSPSATQPYSQGVKDGHYDGEGSVPVARVANEQELQGQGMNPRTRNVCIVS